MTASENQGYKRFELVAGALKRGWTRVEVAIGDLYNKEPAVLFKFRWL